jgi:hypothetical protein
VGMVLMNVLLAWRAWLLDWPIEAAAAVARSVGNPKVVDLGEEAEGMLEMASDQAGE